MVATPLSQAYKEALALQRLPPEREKIDTIIRYGSFPVLVSADRGILWKQLARRLQATLVPAQKLVDFQEAFALTARHFNPKLYHIEGIELDTSKVTLLTQQIQPLLGTTARFLLDCTSEHIGNVDVRLYSGKTDLYPYKYDVLYLLGSQLRDVGGFSLDLDDYPGYPLPTYFGNVSLTLYRYFDIPGIAMTCRWDRHTIHSLGSDRYELLLTHLALAIKRVCTYLSQQPSLIPKPLTGTSLTLHPQEWNINGSGSPYEEEPRIEGRWRGYFPEAALPDGLYTVPDKTTRNLHPVPIWPDREQKKAVMVETFQAVAKNVKAGIGEESSITPILDKALIKLGVTVSKTLLQAWREKLCAYKETLLAPAAVSPSIQAETPSLVKQTLSENTPLPGADFLALLEKEIERELHAND